MVEHKHSNLPPVLEEITKQVKPMFEPVKMFWDKTTMYLKKAPTPKPRMRRTQNI